MEFETFDQLRRQVMTDYGEGRFQEALDLLEMQASRFPAQVYSTANWRMSMAARAGQPARAIAILKESLEQGIWWTAQALHEDPDLASLLGEPEYERLAQECDRRHRLAVAASRPEKWIVAPPIETPEPYPLLVAVHGYGQCAREAMEDWRELADRGWVVAAVQSSMPVGSGAYAWDDENLAQEQVGALVQQVLAEYPIDPQRIVAGGFSQGGGLVIRMALTQQIPLCGFIAVVPFLPGAEGLIKTAAEGRGFPPHGYLVLGGQDHLQQGYPAIQALLDRSALPYQIERHEEAGHAFPANFPDTLTRALAFIFDQKIA